MRGQLIETYKVDVFNRARDQGNTQDQASAIAGISERSGRRIEKGQHRSTTEAPRTWRTRKDPLAPVWDSELEPMLQKEPRLEPLTLYDYLQEQYPGEYQSVKRTLQRRVADWKVQHGPPKEVMFELRHIPGEIGQSDFTELKKVKVTIAGKPFEHLLYHYRLVYSGWQYVEIIQGGESFIGLSQGLQNALRACGGVPKQHRTDSLSAAYKNLKGKRRKPLTQFYEDLCAHYQMQPTRNNTGIAHENGSVEGSHGYFKRRLRQALYLRGSCDFDSVSDYQTFLETIINKLNQRCSDKFEQELPHLQPLPQYRFADYEELSVKVSCHSAITVRRVLYTVPSRLIGKQLSIRLYHDRLVGYVGTQQVVELHRMRIPKGSKNRRARCINYRHVIAGLRKKPRAFLYCTWQQELLPNESWRSLWHQLAAQYDPDSSARLMVEALYIAATQDNESAVEAYLQKQLEQESLTLANLQRHFQLLSDADVPPLDVQQHLLYPYDQLLPSIVADDHTQPLRKSESPPETAPPIEHAQSLGDSREPSHPGTVVLRAVLACLMRIGATASNASQREKGPQRSPTTKRKKFYQL